MKVVMFSKYAQRPAEHHYQITKHLTSLDAKTPSMKTEAIKEWVDGDSGVFFSGRRFRLSGTRAPDIGEPGYKALQRLAQRYAPEGDEVDVTVVATDTYGRSVVKMRSHGKNVNMVLSRWSKEFRE